jgi:hypothetical protein
MITDCKKKGQNTVSGIDVQTVITDFSWQDESRPRLSIDQNNKNVCVEVGSNFCFDICGGSKEDLLSQLEGWRDIFSKAVEVLKGVICEKGSFPKRENSKKQESITR